MDDNNQTIKYDLRQTRFSQNYELSIELYQKQDPDSNLQTIKTTLPYGDASYIQNQFEENSVAEENGSMVCNKESVLIENENLWEIDYSEYDEKKTEYQDLVKGFKYQQDLLYQKPIYSLMQTQKYLIQQRTQHTTLKSQSNSECSDSQQVFSQKLSLIRSLQQKLQTLHKRIKLPSNPITYLDDFKINLEKQYLTYTHSLSVDLFDKEKSSINLPSPIDDLSQISQTQSQIKNQQHSLINDSIESESMLLDKDFQLYSNQKEIATNKIIQHSKNVQTVLHIIETIRIVEVPYLIEVNREIDEKIQSKKGFYFEETEDIHQTFEQFTLKKQNKQNVFRMQKNQQNDRITNESHQDDVNDKSSTIIGRQNTVQKEENFQTSVLSMNDESNSSFHNGLKQKRNEISFNYDQTNHQILSKLQAKNNYTEIEQLEDKVKSLEIQNSQLKQKVQQLCAERQQRQVERCELAEELIQLSQCEQIYQMKLNKYKQTLQHVDEEFAQILHFEQIKLKEHYQKQIQQFQNQQSQYANRIIYFQQLFEQQKHKQQQLTQLLETQQQQILQLQRLSTQKDLDTEIQTLKQTQLETYLIQRETQLKLIIDNLEKDNSELHHLLHQLQLRYESQGFYILNDQALELKKTLEQQDILHIQELDKLENRYSDLIEKYQQQLQNMKKALETVRLNKSNSYSSTKNYTNPNIIHYHPKVRQISSPIRKRQSISISKINRPVLPSQSQDSSLNHQSHHLSLNQKINSTDNRDISIDNDDIRYEKDISVSHFSQKSYTSQHKSQSSSLWMNPLELDCTQELILLQLENLKYQNAKLQGTILSEREQKNALSRKLSTINSTMSKYLDQITYTQEEQQMNQHTFKRCVEELEKQFSINIKLKGRISQLESQKSSQQSIIETNNKSKISINEDQVKQQIQKFKKAYTNFRKTTQRSRPYQSPGPVDLIQQRQVKPLIFQKQQGSSNNLWSG